VQALVKKYITPNQMIYVIVGDAKTQLSKLKALGFGDAILLN
jgi:zinc protease